jgi:hypothetical protein
VNRELSQKIIERRRLPRLLGLAVAASLMVPLGSSAAHAGACAAITMASAMGLYSAPVAATYVAIRTAFANGYTGLVQRMPMVATNASNTVQNQVNADVVLHDRNIAQSAADAVAQVRAEAAMEFTPSRTACVHATRQLAVKASYGHYASTREKIAKDYVNTLMGKAGTMGDKGQLKRLQAHWNNRCGRYMDASSLKAEGCEQPSADMVDLDMRVVDSMFDPLNISEDKYRKAAQDTIDLLTDVEGFDTLRGAALDRNTGQLQFVERMRYATRMGMARNALERIVAIRDTPTEAGADGLKNSRMARYVEMVKGQKVEGNVLSGELPGIAMAGSPRGANVQANMAQLASQKMLLTEFVRMTEQMIAVEAVRLSVDMENDRTNRTAATSIAVTPN